MGISHEDIQELKKVFDDRYVMIEDCKEVQSENAKKFANDDKRIDLVLVEVKQSREENKKGLKFNNWLTAAILGALIVGFIGFYFFIT